MTVTANNLKAITAAELRDGMTIQHPGSGQVLTVSELKDDGTATGGKHWIGKIKGGDGHPHSFNAPLNFPLYQVQDAIATNGIQDDLQPEPVKTPGQLAYEEDCRRCPRHDDGSARPTWDGLSAVYVETTAQAIRGTWERNPTPRQWQTSNQNHRSPAHRDYTGPDGLYPSLT